MMTPRWHSSKGRRARSIPRRSARRYCSRCAVTVFTEDTPLVTIERVRPHVLVKGAEYASGEIVGEEFVIAHGGRVVRYPMAKGLSTTEIVRRMGDG